MPLESKYEYCIVTENVTPKTFYAEFVSIDSFLINDENPSDRYCNGKGYNAYPSA